MLHFRGKDRHIFENIFNVFKLNNGLHFEMFSFKIPIYVKVANLKLLDEFIIIVAFNKCIDNCLI